MPGTKLDSPLEMAARRVKLAQVRRGFSHGEMRHSVLRRLLETLGQSQKLCRQLPRSLKPVPRSEHIKCVQPDQHVEELAAVVNIAAQLPGPDESALHFWSREALRSPQRESRSDLHQQLESDAVAPGWQTIEQSQPPVEICERFALVGAMASVPAFLKVAPLGVRSC